MNQLLARLRSLRPELLTGLLLVSLTAILFWLSLAYQFTQLDDSAYTYGRPQIWEGLSVKSIGWALTSTYDAYWIPATRLSYLADVALSGVTPAAFRRTNILLHALNALLVFVLLRKTTKTLWPSALVAALFAVHPLRVESVVWVTERKDVLCTAWSLLSMLCYVSWQEKEKKRPVFYLASLLCFFIGLCAKPLWVMMPALLLLLDLWPLGRFGEYGSSGVRECGLRPGGAYAPKGGKGENSQNHGRQNHFSNLWNKSSCKENDFAVNDCVKKNVWRLILEKIPYGLLSLLFAGITMITQKDCMAGTVTNTAITASASLPGRIPLMASNYSFYIQKLFWPADLALEYVNRASIPFAESVAAVFALAVLTVLALLLVKKAPYLTFGWLWYLLALLPVSGIIRVGTVTRADRFSYLPHIGLLIALVWLVYEGLRRIPKPGRRAALAILFLIPALLAVQTRRQMAWWKTELSLLERSIELTGGTVTTLNNAGAVLSTAGRNAEAMKQFEKVLRLEPEDFTALSNIGTILAGLGRHAEAIPYFERALRRMPTYSMGHCNLGVSLGKLGRHDEETSSYKKALEIDPHNAAANCNLGNVLFQQGDTNGAVQCYQAALRDDPRNVPTAYNLSRIYADQGKLAEAIGLLRKARRLDPAKQAICDRLEEYLYRQSFTLQLQKKFRPATSGYEEVLELQPYRPDALNNLAWILATCPDPAFRNGERAVELARRAVQLVGESPALLDTLAAALAENEQYLEAAATAGRAIDLALKWNDAAAAADLRAKQELYRSGKPYRETP